MEQQLIARNLVFEKIKKLPKTRMHANFDRIINVPINSEKVSKTVTHFSRHPVNANIVAVQLKRKVEMKNSHLSEFIRPNQLIKAVKKLKALGNPHYQDVKIDENFLEKQSSFDDDDIEETEDQLDSKEQPIDKEDAKETEIRYVLI